MILSGTFVDFDWASVGYTVYGWVGALADPCNPPREKMCSGDRSFLSKRYRISPTRSRYRCAVHAGKQRGLGARGEETGRNELNSWTDRNFVTFFPVRPDVACRQRTRHECVTQNVLNAVFNTNSVANRHRFLHEMWSVARPIWAKCVPSLAKSKHLRAVMATASHLQCWKRKWTNQRCGNTWKLWVSWLSIIFSSCISCNIFFKYLGFKYLWKIILKFGFLEPLGFSTTTISIFFNDENSQKDFLSGKSHTFKRHRRHRKWKWSHQCWVRGKP